MQKMITRFSIMALACLLLACIPQKTIETSHPKTEETEAIPLKEELEAPENYQEWISYLDAMWIDDDYLKEVETKKSIYAIKLGFNTLWGFQFQNEGSEKMTLMGFNTHEGGMDHILRYHADENKLIGEDEEALTIEYLNENLLILHGKNKAGKQYRKVVDEYQELGKILFAGTYKSSKTGKTIVLKANGTTEGMNPTEIFYSVVYDFGMGFEFDIIQFFEKSKRGNINDAISTYHYDIKGSKNKNYRIELYPITCDWENLEHKLGKLADTWILQAR